MIFQVHQNTITAYGQIFDGNAVEFVSLLTGLEKQYDEITLRWHSYGGSVFDGNLIFNTIQNSKKAIEIQIIGVAASMVAIISQSRKDKKPGMVRNGYLMIHAPSGSTYGSAPDHENNAKLLRSMENNFIKILACSTGKSESYVSKWMTGDNWFDAEQALKEGLISEIIEPESETISADLNPEELGVQGMYYQFAALLSPREYSQINLENDMKKTIIEALALSGVNEQSSDTAVIEAVKKHFEAKERGLEEKLDEETEKRKSAEAKLAEQDKAAIDAVIEAAKKAGKIRQDQAAIYQGIAASSGIEVLRTVLAAIPARESITGQIQHRSGKNIAAVGRENWDFDKWQREDPKGFENLAKEEPETFKSIVEAKYKK